jgi:hypothetical protein
MNMLGYFICLLASTTPRTVYQPCFYRCPFKWQCPVSSLINILSLFMLRLSNSSALLAEGPLRKPLACPVNKWTTNAPCVSYLSRPWLHPGSFSRYPKGRLRSYKWEQESCLADWSAISFPSMPMCPGTATSYVLLCYASFTRDWLQSQANLEFIWKVSRALMTDYWKEYRCSYLCSPFVYAVT